MPRNTKNVYTLIRLLLKEQSDLGLHCLLKSVCLSSWNVCGMGSGETKSFEAYDFNSDLLQLNFICFISKRLFFKQMEKEKKN